MTVAFSRREHRSLRSEDVRENGCYHSPREELLDGLRDKMDPIVKKVMGSEDQRRATAMKRLDIREILGIKTMRGITLK